MNGARSRIFAVLVAFALAACAGETQMTGDADAAGAERAPTEAPPPPEVTGAPAPTQGESVDVALAPGPGVSQSRGGACDESRINVILRQAALPAGADQGQNESRIRTAAGEIVDRVGPALNRQSIEISPAIRAFRVSATDAAAAERAADQIAALPDVESAEIDRCEVMIPGRE